jgi:hypothetical protein
MWTLSPVVRRLSLVAYLERQTRWPHKGAGIAAEWLTFVQEIADIFLEDKSSLKS